MRAEDAIRRYHDACKVCFMATCDGDRPRVRPMSPLAVEGAVVWIATFSASAKMAQLAANPRVELCYMDADHSHLRLRGRVEVCSDPAARRRMWDAYALLADYFSSADDPAYVLLKFTTEEAMAMASMSREYEALEL